MFRTATIVKFVLLLAALGMLAALMGIEPWGPV